MDAHSTEDPKEPKSRNCKNVVIAGFLVLFLLTTAAVVALVCVYLLRGGKSVHEYAEDSLPEKVFAVLVAGSNRWENYRHQADVAHAYHLLLQKGIPKENIVTMMYDDIAYNPNNPHQGFISSSPDGPNYYEGLNIDYRQLDVNVDVLVAVLTGNKQNVINVGTGRVIESSSNDNIFVFYADHGGDGVLGMPSGRSLYKSTLQEALSKAKYNQLAVYIEACDSASMLSGLENSPTIYGLTASAPSQSSYGSRCYQGICYGDQFSLAWITDSENHDLFQHRVDKQYQDVKKLVKSTVTSFGQTSLQNQPLIHFQGEQYAKHVVFPNKTENIQEKEFEMVKSYEVPYYMLKHSIQTASSSSDVRDYTQQLNLRLQSETDSISLFDKIVADARPKTPILSPLSHDQQEKCYHNLLTTFESHCLLLHTKPILLREVTKLRSLVTADCQQDVQRLVVSCHNYMQNI